MRERIRREPCKKVTTADHQGKPNGFLLELYKDGGKTVVYLSAASPKAFKGYHLHTVRQSHYVCLKGTMKVTVIEGKKKVEHILSGDRPERLLLPTNVWIGLENIGEEEAWLLNLPNPPYDPDVKSEQHERTRADVEQSVSVSGVQH
ncbi:MAG: dTDP-4-dehydrorhamnose 3,5-epimerase [Parcubacteria group bacterium Gr01-1014_38]|nr:MAG: dTDP-4-dehydrorhamnose 3,5-epimerase [Parcubacteria group bacterium Gr01-1014_38]